MGRIPAQAPSPSKHHEVSAISVANGVLSLVVDGVPVTSDLRTLSPLLRAASDAELDDLQVSPPGYRIHWPRLDEDIAIDGWLGIAHAPADLGRSV